MNTTVLGFAGYMLLCSGLGALIYLLKMGRWTELVRNPFRILSTSDAFMSMLTAVLLLVNQSLRLENSKDFIDTKNNTFFTDTENNQTWNQTCMGYYLNYNAMNFDGKNVRHVTTNCTFANVLLHYAMFLVPFTNAFVSLLIFFVQCSEKLSLITQKCRNSGKISLDKLQGSKERIDTKKAAEPSSSASDLEAPESSEKLQDTAINVNKEVSISNGNDNGKKLTSFGLIMQWLVPTLVTGVVYLSKPQDMNKMRDSSKLECIFKVNFPIESCPGTDMLEDKVWMNPADDDVNFDSDANIVNLDTLKISHPNSEAIDDVISKVRNVVSEVQSTINKTCRNGTEMKIHNDTRIWNITSYDVINDQLTEHSNAYAMRTIPETMPQPFVNNQQEMINDACVTTINDEPFQLDTDETGILKLEFFEHNARNLSNDDDMKLTEKKAFTGPAITHEDNIEMFPTMDTDNDNREPSEYRDTTFVMNTENITNRIDITNTTRQSTAQIYADIIKRIRDAVPQIATRDKIATALNRDSIISNDNVKSGRNKRSIEMPLEMQNGCFLSTKFLKIHLLILLFLIYFMPILISGILHTRAVYTCKNVLQDLTMKSVESGDSVYSVTKSPVRNKISVGENSRTRGWFTEFTNYLHEAKGAEENRHTAFNEAPQPVEAITEQSTHLDEGYENIFKETENMRSMFSILLRSLLLNILMWTPAFLDILGKVFLCSTTPTWLVNLLYMLGILYGVVRNIFNINIAKINRNTVDGFYGKENSVRPSV